MYVVTVAPIRRGIPIDELSYFTKDTVPLGALVAIPLRGKSTSALVLRILPAHEAKSEIKSAEFSLKKLERIEATSFFHPEFITAVESTATYFAASMGATIQAVFPSTLMNVASDLILPAPQKEASTLSRKSERFIFQAEDSERFATYKSHIREVFARGKSCYFILPSLQDIEHTYTHLEKGIQEYTFILHSGLSKKEIIKRWRAIATSTHPVLIIGTPLFLAIPRDDIASIILDRESSGAYIREGRPFIDMRYFAEQFAVQIGADFILGDLFLRTETLYRHAQGELEALHRPKFRIPSTATSTVVDMRISGEQPATGRIAIYSRQLVDLIEETRIKGTHCFILGVRRGFAPMTVCGDCSTVITCTHCSAPVVLHRKQGAKTPTPDNLGREPSPNIFLCHRCGLERDPEFTCANCGGWRLVPLGIGITQAEETLRARFPTAPIFRLDRDSVGKHTDARKIVEQFYQTPGAILLGTEMALPYLTEPVATVAVLSVNSLLTIPDFRMGERVFRLLLTLRQKAREHFLVQSREPETPLFTLATQGNIGEFLEVELASRKRLNYPPYSTLLKFTYEGRKVEGQNAMSEIERLFGIYHPVSFPGFIARVKGKYLMNALIKIPRTEWPNPELTSLIRALPTEITTRINPESVI